MHEWSLADGVISTILSSFNLVEKQVTRVEIVVGELQQIEIEAFEFALTELSKNTPLENAQFMIKREEARFRCRRCGAEWGFDEGLKDLDEESKEAIHFVPEAAHAFMKCPKCNGSDFDVVKGRGMYLAEVELVEK